MSEPKLPKQEVITIEPPMNGLISEYSPIANPIEGGQGQYRYSFGASPVRPGYKGHLAPAEIFNSTVVTDSSSYINSLPRAVSVDNTQSTPVEWYMLGGLSGTAPRLIQVSGGAVTADHDISAVNNFTTIPTQGTGFWGEDILFYEGTVSSSTVRFILYSWNNSATGGVGLYDVEDSSYVSDNFFSSSYFSGFSNPLPNVPHRFAVGYDQTVYMTNGQYVTNWDCTSDQSATNGTYDDKFIDVGLGWIATDIAAYGGQYLAVAAVKTGGKYISPSSATEACQARIFLFDGQSAQGPAQVYDLDDWYVSSLYVKNGLLYAFTQGLNNTTKVKMLPFYPPAPSTIFELPTSFIGNAPLPNQVEWWHEMLTWVSPNQTVFSIQQTQTGYACFTPYYVSNGQAGGMGVGLLKNINGNYLFAGFQASNGTAYTIRGAKGDGTSDSMISTLAPSSTYIEFRSRLIDVGYRATIVKMRAYFSNFSSTSSLYISLLPNRTAYTLDVNNNPTGDALKWTINTTNHPLVATNFTASTAEKGSISIPDISQFWLNFKFTNTSTSATPPILRKLEITIQETTKP